MPWRENLPWNGTIYTLDRGSSRLQKTMLSQIAPRPDNIPPKGVSFSYLGTVVKCWLFPNKLIANVLNILYLWHGEKECLQQSVESWIWRNRKINLHVKGTKFCWISTEYRILGVRLFMTAIGQRLKRANWAGWRSCFSSMQWQRTSD